MNSFFIRILSLSLSASLLLIPLLLLQPFYKKYLNKSWQFYIYLVIVLRSLLPFGAEVNLLQSGIQYVAAEVEFNREEKQIANQEEAPTGMQSTALEESYESEQGTEAELETVNAGLSDRITAAINTHAVGLIWLSIAAGLWLRTIIIYFQSTHRLRYLSRKAEHEETISVYQQICKELGLKRFPKVMINEEAPSPVLLGIFHPVIILPEEERNQAKLQFIFKHELTHYKRFDLLYKWLIQFAVCIHWFNPLFYLVRKEIEKNCEFSCDESVVRDLTMNEVFEYGNTLVYSIRPWKENTKTKISITLNEELALIKERLESIMNRKKKTKLNIVITLVLTVLLLYGAVETGANAFDMPNNSIVNHEKTTKKTEDNNKTENKTTSKADNKSADRTKEPLLVTNCKIVYDDTPYKWPSIEETVKNNTDKVITSYESSWLAFDKNGKPLQLYWDARNVDKNGDYGNVGFGIGGVDYGYVVGIKTFSKKSYLWETDNEMKINAGKTKIHDGWYLFDGWWDQTSKKHKAAYLLSCIKTVTYKDGAVWENPNYETWVKSYKGKIMSIENLKAYYK